MELRNKLYPYPVLDSSSEQYKTGNFETDLNSTIEGYNIRLVFKSKLDEKGLMSLINQGKATFVYHLECPQTGFRNVHITDQLEFSCTIPGKNLRGYLEICCFVIAKENIVGYTNLNFSEFYDGLTFDIDAGGILATGDSFNVNVDINIDELSDIPSIFSIVPILDSSITYMQVDTSQKKLLIKLPKKDFENYKILNLAPEYLSSLTAMTVIPALTQVLGELKAQNIEDRMGNSELNWYKTLKKYLKENLDCDLETDEAFHDKSPFELAQLLVNSPLTEALTNAVRKQDDGDDE